MTTGPLEFDPPLAEFFESRTNDHLTVVAGANNSGKSLLLKNLKRVLGRTAYMVGPARFYHVYQIGTALRDPRELDNWEQQFQQSFHQADYNHEQNFIDLNRILINLSDATRTKLFNLAGELLGSSVSLKRVEEDNDLSMRYIDIDGRNLSLASTGSRLLLTLLGICMDERFETILIDEPELGLSPRVQQQLSRFFQDSSARAAHFPHLKRIVVATHSHLFLARNDIRSNYSVHKQETNIDLRRVETVGDFHRLQFNLLGNSLEDMYLPAAIIIVEGPSDQGYIDRLVQLRHPDRRITVIPSGGDAKAKVASLRETLGDLQSSPFRSRLFVVMDQIHTYSDSARLAAMGVLPENIVIWDKNGIEYLYPADIMSRIFSSSDDDLDRITITDDAISLNDVSHKKGALATLVLPHVTASSPVPVELEQKLLSPLARALE